MLGSYDFDWSVFQPSLGPLADGLLLTLMISAVAIAVPTVLAFPLAAARMSAAPEIRIPAQLYIEVFRCTPLLVQLLWIYFALPAVTGITLSAVTSGLIALSGNMTAFLAESYRAGLQSVPKEQIEAAQMLRLSRFDILRRIMIPQAFRQQIPNILSLDIQLFKDSSLVSVIGITDLTFQGNVLSSQTYRPLEIFTMVGLLYFLVAFPASLLVSWIERRNLLNSQRGAPIRKASWFRRGSSRIPEAGSARDVGEREPGQRDPVAGQRRDEEE